MRLRFTAGGKSVKAPRRKAAKPRRGPKTARRRSSATAEHKSEIARLTRELSESLEQQTAMSEVLRVISSSPGDLQPVFATILEKAVHICDAKFGNLWLRERDNFRIGATHGSPAEWSDFLRREPLFQVDPRFGLGRLILTKQTYQVADVAAEPTYQDKLRVATIELAHARTLVGVPLVRDGEVIGAFAIYRQEVRPFTDKQIEVVENFAAQAVIAIENARLFEAERQRTQELTESLEQQTATADVLGVISSSPGDLQPVFGAILENAARICGANFGNIFRWDGDALHLIATYHTPAAFAKRRGRTPFRPNQDNPVAEMLAAKAVMHVADLAQDERYTRRRDPDIVAAVELGGIRTFAAIPMLKEGDLIGVLIVYRQEVRPFTDKQVALLENFAAQALVSRCCAKARPWAS
jgi:GAF domain-containing protein